MYVIVRYHQSVCCLCKQCSIIPVATATLSESNPGDKSLWVHTVNMPSHAAATSWCKPHPSFPVEKVIKVGLSPFN